jgi:hypothetical protein
MKRLGIVVLLLAGLFHGQQARADGPCLPWPWQRSNRGPRLEWLQSEDLVSPDRIVPLVVELDEGAKAARLVIPRPLVANLHLAEGGGLDRPDALVRAQDLPTMVAGVSLSLAFVFAGLKLARLRKMPNGRQVGLLLALVALGGVGATFVWANQPPNAAPPQPLAVPCLLGTSMVTVEVVEHGDTIKLIVNRAHLARFTRRDDGLVELPRK